MCYEQSWTVVLVVFGSEDLCRDDIDGMISGTTSTVTPFVMNYIFECLVILYCSFWGSKNKNLSKLLPMCTRFLHTFPNVETILSVGPNASGERTFSELKIVKSYLRNSMEQERLTSLSILCIKSGETKKCDFNVQKAMVNIGHVSKCRSKCYINSFK